MFCPRVQALHPHAAALVRYRFVVVVPVVRLMLVWTWLFQDCHACRNIDRGNSKRA